MLLWRKELSVGRAGTVAVTSGLLSDVSLPRDRRKHASLNVGRGQASP